MLQPRTAQPIQACCLYSIVDDKLRQELEIRLDPLVRAGLLECHYQHQIGAGLEVNAEVKIQIEGARLIFMLVSPELLARHYEQIQLALSQAESRKGFIRIMPIICRAVDWSSTPLNHLKECPRTGKPLSSLVDRDEAWIGVVNDIKLVIDDLIPKWNFELCKRTWSIPVSKSLHFTGRDKLLRELEESLSQNTSCLAIIGMGGVGKTQLVLEYLHHHTGDYPIVFWIKAEGKATLAAEFARLASALSLGDKEAPHRVLRWLEEQGRFLLIFDNVNQYQDIEGYLPHAGKGHVLLTSRNPAWGDIAKVLRVRVFEPAESLLFLFRRTQQKDEKTAALLADELGHLPLALAQAAAYIERTGKSLVEYLTLYRRRPRELRALGPVATTWALSLDALKKAASTRPAVALMNLCAFLSSDGIPVAELLRWADYVPPSLASCLRDEVKLDYLIGCLRGYSLMERSEGMLSVHRLVQAVVRDRLEKETRKRWIESTEGAIHSSFSFREVDPMTWAPCSQLLPHAIAIVRHIDTEGISSEKTAQLLNRIGLYLMHRAEFNEARQVLERALELSESLLGHEHPTLIIRLTNLADALREQGEYRQSEGLLRRALEMGRHRYGENHSIIGCILNNLSLILYDEYDHDGARRCLSQALHILCKPAKERSWHLSSVLNNFGVLLYQNGEVNRARARLEEGYELALSRQGVRAAIETNLGQVAQEEGDLKQALSYYESALHMVENTHGPKHPRIASILHRRSRISWELGNLDQAKADCQRALAIAQQVYAPENPAIAGLLETLGRIYYEMGDEVPACEMVQRAVHIFGRMLGVHHARTVEARQTLLTITKRQDHR